MENVTTAKREGHWKRNVLSASRILDMVPTKKVDKTLYELWHGKVPNLSYLKVWGCEAHVKRHTPDKLQQNSFVCCEVTTRPGVAVLRKTSQEDFNRILCVKLTGSAVKNILKDDTKSQTWVCLRFDGGALYGKSSNKVSTATTCTDAEYIDASEAAKRFPSIDYPIKMNCDNSAAIIIAKESGIQKGARHFQRKYHYVRECIKTGEIDIVKVHTDENLADPFMKALAGPKLTRHARSMGLRPASSFM
ncbi:hypothetical protein Tco_0561725 [Tanacetum coccineum]